MAITRTFAKKYLTKSEFQIVEGSFADGMKKLDAETAKKKITLARRQRDKFRDLHKRQRLAARGKRTSKSERKNSTAARDSVLSLTKARLFNEAIGRYDNFLKEKQKLSGRKKPVKKKAARKSPSKSSAKKTAKKVSDKFKKLLEERKARRASKAAAKKSAKRSRASSSQSLFERKASTFRKNRSPVVNAHVRSRGRRNQAKRDSR